MLGEALAVSASFAKGAQGISVDPLYSRCGLAATAELALLTPNPRASSKGWFVKISTRCRRIAAPISAAHGPGTADRGNRTVPDPTRAKHPCCTSCTDATPAIARRILIAWRAMRAGLSQAPPSPI
jgi:hypothetical protein